MKKEDIDARMAKVRSSPVQLRPRLLAARVLGTPSRPLPAVQCARREAELAAKREKMKERMEQFQKYILENNQKARPRGPLARVPHVLPALGPAAPPPAPAQWPSAPPRGRSAHPPRVDPPRPRGPRAPEGTGATP